MITKVLYKLVKDLIELIIAFGMFATAVLGLAIGILPALDAIGIYDNVNPIHPTWTILWWSGVLCCYVFFLVLDVIEEGIEKDRADTPAPKWYIFTVSMSILTSWTGLLALILIFISLSRKREEQRKAEFENKIKGR